MRHRRRVSRRFAIRVVLCMLAALLLPSAAALPLDSVPTLKLIGSDPGEDAVLRNGEPLYLRLRYRSATPLHVLLSGYYRGDMVGNFRQDSEELLPAGKPGGDGVAGVPS